jgi:hypothetical protein
MTAPDRLVGRLPVWLVAVGLIASGCATGIGQTFEPGVEHVPGPANFVIRILPPEVADRVSFTGYGDRVVLFSASRGTERFLLGTDLPSALRARVDGRDCSGSIEMVSDMEYDGTLTIQGVDCDLRLDQAHRVGVVDHRLQDNGPVAS